MSLIDFVATATSNYIEQMPKAQRKSYGQFFTSCETAQFMARLFDLDSIPSTVSILDPGAGSGMRQQSTWCAMKTIHRCCHCCTPT